MWTYLIDSNKLQLIDGTFHLALESPNDFRVQNHAVCDSHTC